LVGVFANTHRITQTHTITSLIQRLLVRPLNLAEGNAVCTCVFTSFFGVTVAEMLT